MAFDDAVQILLKGSPCFGKGKSGVNGILNSRRARRFQRQRLMKTYGLCIQADLVSTGSA
jgi:hypothetical protein